MWKHRTVDELEADFDKLLAPGETVSRDTFDTRAAENDWEPHQVGIMLRGAIRKGNIHVINDGSRALSRVG